ncbi:KOW domain-containing RNA-binding protein [Myceligenerans halotolerans]
MDDSTSSANEPRVWQVGDRVRVVDGPRMLLGAVGMVVEIEVPGAWPVRVYIERRGFDRALLAAHELEPAREGTS